MPYVIFGSFMFKTTKDKIHKCGVYQCVFKFKSETETIAENKSQKRILNFNSIYRHTFKPEKCMFW